MPLTAADYQSTPLPRGYIAVNSPAFLALGYFRVHSHTEEATRECFINDPNAVKTPGQLEVLYPKGIRWAYANVPPGLVLDLLRSDHKGTFFAASIKKRPDLYQAFMVVVLGPKPEPEA